MTILLILVSSWDNIFKFPTTKCHPVPLSCSTGLNDIKNCWILTPKLTFGYC